jgi:ferric-dicitrate binding protein FerR (iron transport regulator)
MQSDRTEELLDRWADQEASPSDVAELRVLLRGSADSRRVFVERVILEVHLYRSCALLQSGPVKSEPERIGSNHNGARLTAIAAALVIGVGLVLLLRTSPKTANDVLSGKVLVNGVRAMQIPDGAGIKVEQDKPAVVRLADGSRIELAPTSAAVIRRRSTSARQGVELTQGGGKFLVQKGEERFRVDTPVGSVTALGTEFSVEIRAAKRKKAVVDGATIKIPLELIVSVSAGKVQVDVAGKSYPLSFGQHGAFDEKGQHGENDDGERGEKDEGNDENHDEHDGREKRK